MKVLHVCRDIFGPVGMPYESRQMAISQAALGHEVVALCRHGNDLKRFSGSSVHTISLKGVFGCTREIEAMLRDFQPDIAHVYSLWTPEHSMWMRPIQRHGVPYVTEPHGGLNPQMMRARFGGKKNTPYHHFAKFAYRALMDTPLLRAGVGVRTLSAFEKNLALGAHLPEPFLCPCGFDSEWLQPEPTYRLPSEGKPLNVFFIGRLDVWQKGLDLILEAFRLLKRANLESAFQLTLAGPALNHSDDLLRAQIRALDLKNIAIVGPAYGEDKQRLFQEAHLFIHPSRFEGMAKTAREAVAYGVPILASYESNFGDWVESESMGMTVPLSAEEIARSLEQIRKAPQPLQAWSENAFRFSHKWTWPTVAEQTIATYQKLLASR